MNNAYNTVCGIHPLHLSTRCLAECRFHCSLAEVVVTLIEIFGRNVWFVYYLKNNNPQFRTVTLGLIRPILLADKWKKIRSFSEKVVTIFFFPPPSILRNLIYKTQVCNNLAHMSLYQSHIDWPSISCTLGRPVSIKWIITPTFLNQWNTKFPIDTWVPIIKFLHLLTVVQSVILFFLSGWAAYE